MDEPQKLEDACSCPPSKGTAVDFIPTTLRPTGARILVVDDAENMRILLEEYLNDFGYDDIVTAGNADEAFGVLTADSEIPAPDAVDLVLMDITMPGIDGIEACREVKGHMDCKDVPVIMVTNHVEPEYLKRAFEAGAMDYVTTPINRLDLQFRVNSALKLKQSLDAQKRATALVKDLLEERDHALQATKEYVKVLQGLLPICASCKKIRNCTGGWSQLESYISDHTEAEFSHGMCPDCQDRLYPQIHEQPLEKGLLPLQ